MYTTKAAPHQSVMMPLVHPGDFCTWMLTYDIDELNPPYYLSGTMAWPTEPVPIQYT